METLLSQRPFSPQFTNQLVELIRIVFPDIAVDDTVWRLQHMPSLTCWSVHADNQMVAFKIGYAMHLRHYYSWLGGVHPEWKRQGLASQLMTKQHDWLVMNGFESVETCIRSPNEAMEALNLASGFEEVGKRKKHYGYEVTFEKKL